MDIHLMNQNKRKYRKQISNKLFIIIIIIQTPNTLCKIKFFGSNKMQVTKKKKKVGNKINNKLFNYYYIEKYNPQIKRKYRNKIIG